VEVLEDVVVALFVLVRVALFVGIVWLIVREVRKSGRTKK
jgi:hypothetical protein